MKSQIKMWSVGTKSSNSGYGFIASTDNRRDYYFRYEDVTGCLYPDLRAGMPVEFTPIEKGNNRLAIAVRVIGEVRTNYQLYIRSSEWKEIAISAKQRAGNKCQVCNKSGSTIKLEAHHRTYERLGRELPEDLTVLCRTCHQLYESNKKLPAPPISYLPQSYIEKNGTHEEILSAPITLLNEVEDKKTNNNFSLKVLQPANFGMKNEIEESASDPTPEPMRMQVSKPGHQINVHILQVRRNFNIYVKFGRAPLALASMLVLILFAYLGISYIYHDLKSPQQAVFLTSNVLADKVTSPNSIRSPVNSIPTNDPSTSTLANTSIFRKVEEQQFPISQDLNDVLQQWDKVHHEADRTLDSSKLSLVLTGKALQEQKAALESLKVSGCYWDFEDLATPEVVAFQEISPSEATVQIRKHWEGKLYCNGIIDQKQSFNDIFTIRYHVLLTDAWRIAEKISALDELRFCDDSEFDMVEEECQSTKDVFTGNVDRIYVSWEPSQNYENSSFRRQWYFEGNSVPFLVREDKHHYAYLEVETLKSIKKGSYHVELYVGNVLIQQANFIVAP